MKIEPSKQQQAVTSPLLEANIAGATNAIINVTGGASLTLFEVEDAAEVVRAAANTDINTIFGAVINEELSDAVVVTVIATGFERNPEPLLDVFLIKIKLKKKKKRKNQHQNGIFLLLLEIEEFKLNKVIKIVRKNLTIFILLRRSNVTIIIGLVRYENLVMNNIDRARQRAFD